MKSYVKRKIELNFTLGEGTFGEDGSNTIELKGLRVNAAIIKAGGLSMGTAQLRVYGMKLSTMNKLSTLGMLMTLTRKNTVTVKAGDDDTGMHQVFYGTIFEAYVDFNAAPQVAFNVVAQAGLVEAVKPVDPSSFEGSVDVADVIAQAAKVAGLKFENNGVSVKLANPYFSGTARTQMYEAAEMANVNIFIDNGTVAIWPRGKPRGDQVPEVSAKTGLVGYPGYTSKGISLKVLYMPHIEYGSPIKVESTLTPANGQWLIQTLVYNLESETPDGPWFMQIEAGAPGFVGIFRAG